MSVSAAAEKQVGSTGLTLPPFGFGSAHLGELYAKVDEADARATLDAAWDAGVRLYDTAPWYGRGLSEHRVGGFLRTKPRGDFKLITKVGRTLYRPKDPAHFDRSPWVGGLNFEVNFDYTYDGIMRSYAQALSSWSAPASRRSRNSSARATSRPSAWASTPTKRWRRPRRASTSTSASSPCRTRFSISAACIAAWPASPGAAYRPSSARPSPRASSSPDRPGRLTMPMARLRRRCRPGFAASRPSARPTMWRFPRRRCSSSSRIRSSSPRFPAPRGPRKSGRTWPRSASIFRPPSGPTSRHRS
ncbi:MAG: aldo/keto reductase [Rhizobiales bacterium]|nr:aldo/keto reductase [Hyphomicrobiales bacterium]